MKKNQPRSSVIMNILLSFSEEYCLDFAILIECEWHGYLFDKVCQKQGHRNFKNVDEDKLTYVMGIICLPWIELINLPKYGLFSH